MPGVNHLLVPATTGEVDEYGTLKDKQVSQQVTRSARHVAEEDALARTLDDRARRTSRRAPTVPSGRRRRSPRCVARSAARCLPIPIDATDGHRRARPRRGAGPRHHHRPALFRVRDRRRAARDGRGRVAHRRLGSEPRACTSCRPRHPWWKRSPARWLIDLLGLPADASVGFVTGCHMANFTALAAARHELLRRAGWDVEADGLQGAPRLRVIVGDEVHVSVIGALRMLGIGVAPGRARGRRRSGTPEARGARRRARRRAGSDDRLRAGRQRELGRVRSARRDCRPHQPASARGSTWTARSGCGPPPAARCGITSAASSGPTRGRPTRTSG